MHVIGQIQIAPNTTEELSAPPVHYPILTHGGSKTFTGDEDPTTITLPDAQVGDQYQRLVLPSELWSYDGAAWVQQNTAAVLPGTLVTDVGGIPDPTFPIVFPAPLSPPLSAVPDMSWEPEVVVASLGPGSPSAHVPKFGTIPNVGWTYDAVTNTFVLLNGATGAWINAVLGGFAGAYSVTYKAV